MRTKEKNITIFEYTEEQKQELERLADKPDSEIDFSDIPEVLDWSKAVRGGRFHPARKSVSLNIDADIVSWFSRRYGSYQLEINNILKEYIKSQSF